MTMPAIVWAFLGIPGPREVIVVTIVALVLYGRSGVLRTTQARMVRSWLSPTRRVAPGTPPTSVPREGRRGWSWEDRTFWFLTIVAATAVTAWIVTRTLIAGASRPPN